MDRNTILFGCQYIIILYRDKNIASFIKQMSLEGLIFGFIPAKLAGPPYCAFVELERVTSVRYNHTAI